MKQISRFGVYGLICHHSRFLLTLKKNGPYQGLLDLPGGGIEFGESPEETLRRELIEEAALTFNEFEFFSIENHLGVYAKNQEQFQFHHIGAVFQVNKISFIPDRRPEEELFWLGLHELNMEKLNPIAKKIFNKLEIKS